MSGKNKGRRHPTPGTVAADIERHAREARLYALTHGPRKFPRPKPRRGKGQRSSEQSA